MNPPHSRHIIALRQLLSSKKNQATTWTHQQKIRIFLTYHKHEIVFKYATKKLISYLCMNMSVWCKIRCGHLIGPSYTTWQDPMKPFKKLGHSLLCKGVWSSINFQKIPWEYNLKIENWSLSFSKIYPRVIVFFCQKFCAMQSLFFQSLCIIPFLKYFKALLFSN